MDLTENQIIVIVSVILVLALIYIGYNMYNKEGFYFRYGAPRYIPPRSDNRSRGGSGGSSGSVDYQKNNNNINNAANTKIVNDYVAKSNSIIEKARIDATSVVNNDKAIFLNNNLVIAEKANEFMLKAANAARIYSETFSPSESTAAVATTAEAVYSASVYVIQDAYYTFDAITAATVARTKLNESDPNIINVTNDISISTMADTINEISKVIVNKYNKNKSDFSEVINDANLMLSNYDQNKTNYANSAKKKSDNILKNNLYNISVKIEDLAKAIIQTRYFQRGYTNLTEKMNNLFSIAEKNINEAKKAKDMAVVLENKAKKQKSVDKKSKEIYVKLAKNDIDLAKEIFKNIKIRRDFFINSKLYIIDYIKKVLDDNQPVNDRIKYSELVLKDTDFLIKIINQIDKWTICRCSP
jgi:hypothetical protein